MYKPHHQIRRHRYAPIRTRPLAPFPAILACALASTASLDLVPAAHAVITATGDLDPFYPAANPDPWNVGDNLSIGDTGTGTLIINNVGSASVVSNINGYLGDSTGSTGTATVDGAGAQWRNSNYVIVGRSGTGILNIQNGGLVKSTRGSVGGSSGSIGTATVTGAGSVWSNGGTMTVGHFGNGTLNIENGGVVDVTRETWVGSRTSGSGAINFNNGTLNTDGILASPGELLGVGTINTNRLVSDIDLVFNSTTGLQQTLSLNSLPGQNITIHLDASAPVLDSSLGAGYRGAGTLTITDGLAVSSTYGNLGYHPGANGTATVTGAGSQWNTSSYLTVGSSGAGTLNIEAGGVVSNSYSRLGHFTGSTGTVTVTGAGSQWNNSGGLAIGDTGNGTLNIEAGGVVSSKGGLLGYESSSTSNATVTGAGSRWENSGDLTVGYSGNGTMNIENDGVVSNSSGRIGYEYFSTGTVTVTGADSRWENSGILSVGNHGTGTLNIENGATVSNVYGSLGALSNSSGTATVTGAGSTWNNSYGLSVGGSGTGTLNIENGGVVNVSTDTLIGKQSAGSGVINFNNGTLNTSGLLASLSDLLGTGTINATALVSDIDLVFDATTGLQQQFILNSQPGQNVTINLDATGPANAGTMGAGYRGTGTLLITDGRVVSAEDGYLGYHTGSDGTATVSGAGSVWDNDDYLYVGDDGSGTLNIDSGGTVRNKTGYLGFGAYADGTATVSGAGSTWINRYDLHVGGYGAGTLTIENGGIVSNSRGHIGHYGLSSSGTVTVSGPGSTWNNSRELYVGLSNGGSLHIENGGTVNNTSAYIADGFGTTTVTVTGAGSTWNNSGVMHVGRSNTGTLNIENGGVVNVSQDTWVGEKATGTGTIHFNNGTLNTAGLLASPGELPGIGTINAATLVSDIDLVFDATTGLQQQIILNSLPGQHITINLDASSPANVGSLGAGYRGMGSLTIADGLAVSSQNGYIGYHAGSTGIVTVTGNGSLWRSGNNLYIGTSGTGTLNIENGGLVENTGYQGFVIAQEATGEGTLNLAGGTLFIYSNNLTTGDGTAYLNLTGGTLDLNGNDLIAGSGTTHFAFTGGALRGAATIDLGQPMVQDGGTLALGGSSRVLEVIDGYNLNAGTLLLTLGGIGDPIDHVQVTGDIHINALDTTLELRALGPMAAGTYTLMQAVDGGTITGMFENVSPFNLFGVNVSVQNLGDAITLTLDADLIFSDPNMDGFVGVDDLNIVLVNWNQNVAAGDVLSGDLNGDGFVGVDDLNAVLLNWNAGTPPPVEVTGLVPEPGSVAVLLVGLVGLSGRRRSA